MKPLLTFAVLSTVLIMTACPKNAPTLDLSSEAIQKAAVVEMRNNVFVDEVFQYECWREPRKKVSFTNDAQQIALAQSKGQALTPRSGKYSYNYICIDQATNETVDGEQKAREVRNQIFQKGRGILDEIYFKYSTALRTNRSRADFILDLVDIGLGTSIGLTKGTASTIRDLGIALAGFRAGRDAATIRLYDNQTTEIIIDQMDASRSEVFLNFRDHDSKKSISDYPIDSVFTELFKYYAVGSQTEAFKRIRRKTAAQAETRESEILRISEPITPFTPTTEQVKSSLEYGTVLRNFRTEIASAEGDSTNKAGRFTAVHQKLLAIYTEMTTGSLKESFAKYITAVKDESRPGVDLNQIVKGFEDGSSLDKKKLDDRLSFLDLVRIEISKSPELVEDPEALKKKINELFNSNKP